MRTTKTFIKASFLLLFLLIASEGRLIASSVQLNPPLQLPVEAVYDKIRGGLLGQMLGNLNGIPHEFKYNDAPGNIKNYIPSLPDGARTDDDTDFEWVYIMEMQKMRNIFLPYEDINSLWVERINRNIWCANRFARHLMDINIKPPFTGYSSLNPWAGFNISGSFLSETFGLLAPAMPQTAAGIGLHYTKVASDTEPAQTTQLFTTMISTAFVENDINKILDAGIASLDQKSKVFSIINDVRQWHKQYPDNWRETRRLLKEKYTLEGGRIRDNNGIELNTGATIAALLYGEGDFAETMKAAFNFGWDADNTAATAGTIVGVTYGYRRMLTEENWQIVDRYRNTTRDNMPMNETITSFGDRLIELFELLLEEKGGKKVVANQLLVYEIPAEKPAPVIHLPTSEDQKQLLPKEQEIENMVLNGDREAKARAAYLAVATDIGLSIKGKHPKQWEEACYNLSGYWKIMDNVFFGDFQELDHLRKKFKAAGFKTPIKRYTDSEIYNDSEVWKDPQLLY